MNCEFCKNVFKTKYVLKNHQKRAKYCLIKQKNLGRKIVTDFYKCEYCSQEMASDHKSRHLKSCKIRCVKINDEKVANIIILEKNNMYLKLELAVKNKELEEVYKQLEIYKEMADREMSCIEEIAKQPRVQQTTNTQTNNLMMMQPLDMTKDNFAQSIEDKFTKEYFLNGQKGAAQFAVDNLLKDKDGKLRYVCTDPSRHIYRFKSQDGSLERDVKAKKLTAVLAENLTKKSHLITAEEITTGDSDVFVVYTTNFQDIRDLSDDNGDFRAELASLTSV